MTTPELATCTRCGQTKPVTDYSPNTHTRKGHQSACRACVAARQKQLRADGHYREREKRHDAAYRAAMTALRERHRDEFRALYQTALGGGAV